MSASNSKAGGALLSVGEIETMLEVRIEALVLHLLPNARKDGREMCVGSLAGEAGQSLRINVGSPAKRGWWKDFSSGEGGDALLLVAHVLFMGNLAEAVAWSKSWLGLDDSDPARLAQQRREVQAASAARAKAAQEERERWAASARARWQQGVSIAGTLVERYLLGRGIDLRVLGKAPGALRYHKALQYGPSPAVGAAVTGPAMVAMITNLDGQHIATHRTWIKPDGSGKAGAAEIGTDAAGQPNDPKKVMGAYQGGHIPVWKGLCPKPLKLIPNGTDVYVSEGVEDGLTAACADPALRIIAMISLSNLMALELPVQMGRLIILKQNDPAGSPAAKALARAVAHHRAAGRRVLFVEPPPGVKDLNDLVQHG